MTVSDVFIIGAGPAGLTASYLLTKEGVSTTVIEADPVYVGGISRTANYKEFKFDKDGLFASIVLSVDSGMGQKQDVTVNRTHGEKEGALLVTSESVKVELPGGQGSFEQTATLTYKKVGDFWLVEKREAKSKMSGQDFGGNWAICGLMQTSP